MQGHLPGPPQPHFPEGLAPVIGYLATREAGPWDEDDQPQEEPGWSDDIGEWEPVHRPWVKVTAVVVSFSLVIAGLGTVLELLLAPH